MAATNDKLGEVILRPCRNDATLTTLNLSWQQWKMQDGRGIGHELTMSPDRRLLFRLSFLH
ncbi:MAG: hypothetical protein Q8P67_04360 [archaeon]|nr:hypothetical protein [archaeon]